MNPKVDRSQTVSGDGRTSARRSVTRAEWVTLGLIALPFVVLAGCFALDAIEANAAKANIREYVAQQIAAGHPVDRVSLARRYDQRTSREETPAWATLLEASRPLQDAPSLGVRSGDAGLDLPSTLSETPSMARQGESSLPVVDFVVKRDAALTRAREALLNRGSSTSDDKAVWFPFVLWARHLHSISSVWEFYEDDNQAFRSAIAHGENDLAIEVLQRFIRTNWKLNSEIETSWTATAKIIPGEVIHLIRESLAVADWDADQLATLREMIETAPNYAERLDQQMQQTMAVSLDELDLSDGVVAGEINREYRGSLPVKLSSQAAWQWIQFMQRARDMGEPGTWSRFLSLQSEPWYDQRHGGLDTVSLTSFPFASGTSLIASTTVSTHFANAGMATYESNRRWALTAIGIKQYQMQNNAWPQSLADLRDVGLTSDDWQIMPGVEFGYQDRPLLPQTTAGSEVVLWTAQLKEGHLDEAIQRFAAGHESVSPPMEVNSTKFDMQRITLIRK
ncbi:hypothetical protein [Novipirellula caenicola]|uniref:Uncharacterized protein n=1 Tax=Novipirellula caenicola TaxID=1536901 RepID=A0ABP9VLI2_9BACT